MSSSWEVTWTLCAVAVSGLAEGEGAGVDVDLAVVVEAGGVETASCAVMILVIKRIAPSVIRNFFIKYSRFQSLLIGCGVRVSAKPDKSGRVCANANRDSGEVA
jgi:hypothetical protein